MIAVLKTAKRLINSSEKNIAKSCTHRTLVSNRLVKIHQWKCLRHSSGHRIKRINTLTYFLNSHSNSTRRATGPWTCLRLSTSLNKTMMMLVRKKKMRLLICNSWSSWTIMSSCLMSREMRSLTQMRSTEYKRLKSSNFSL